jgi:hypothetical protein
MSDELKPQSIDSGAFRELLWDIVRTAGNEWVIRNVIAHIDAWRVPAGYKLAPIESTAEMNILGRRALRNCGNDHASIHDAELCWSAMIEAAPKPEDA